jgi:hypothetical protein
VIDKAASAKGDCPVESESGTYALDAWVRYPTEYSEITGSILGKKFLISASMIAVESLNIPRCSPGRGKVRSNMEVFDISLT